MTIFYIMGVAIFIGYVLTMTFVVSNNIKSKKNESQNTQQNKTKQPSRKSERRDEVINSLDWMLLNGIITNTEYNQILVKCLPFLE